MGGFTCYLSIDTEKYHEKTTR